MPNDASPEVHLPLDFLQQLQQLAAGSNPALAKALESIPGIARFAPTVDVGQPIRMLALELGRLISRQRSPEGMYIFQKAGAIVTVEEQTGEEKTMTPGRFVGYVEQFCAFRTSSRSSRMREGLTRDDAGLVLEQDVFHDSLRELTAVHTMRLPVIRNSGVLEWLEPGYDAETGIFTCDLVPYPMDWTLEQGVDWLVDVWREMPWNGMEDSKGDDRTSAAMENRSFAVHMAASLGTYCRAMFPLGTLRPLIAYFANKPGSGKTRLAEGALAPLYGFVGGTAAPKDEEKMDVKLETVARAMRPWVIFDDIGGSLRSNSLNKFLTEAKHTGRCFNSNSEFFDVPAVTQIFATANELSITEDLQRRALIAELFLTEDVRGRQFSRTITSNWLAKDEIRARFLAAFCAILRHWDAPGAHNSPRPRHPRPLETFDEWTAVIGGIVVRAGFADPLAVAEMDVGGASTENETKKLLIKVAGDRGQDCVIRRTELVEAARDYGLLETIVGAKGDPDPDDAANKRFGKQMTKWRGQKLATEGGRRFQFGHKHSKSGATYPLTFLKG